MCGLAGAIGALDANIGDVVSMMSDAMRHRGPDGDGHWRSDSEKNVSPNQRSVNGVVLSHRRLAIIDLRDIANQPMQDTQTGNVIIFNGEIYNYREIRHELSGLGVEFVTAGDTEVLLKAFAIWGIACLERLRGMFAFALWDCVNECVYIVRDRLGIKPIYYTLQQSSDGQSFMFASELRALLASGRVPRVLDDVSVHSYLWHGFVPGPRTIVDNVRLLEPGTYIKVALDGTLMTTCRYWTAPLSRDTGISDLSSAQEVLAEAVSIRLRSDVPVGVFLSGGVDSSVVANAAHKASDSPLTTYTIGFEEAGFDESKHSAEFAQAIGVANDVHYVGQGEFVDCLPSALAAMDQPTFDGINSYLISRVVRANGVTVALSGAGGDELFGGYPSFRRLANADRLAWLTRFIPPSLLRSAGQLSHRVSNPHSFELRRFLQHSKGVDHFILGADTVGGYQSLYSVFSERVINRLHTIDLSDEMMGGLECERYEALREAIAGYSVEAAVGYLETQSFLSERVLRDADAASMAVSLELRLPLIDHVFVETLSQYSSNLRYRPFGQKALLRSIGLPDATRHLFDRPKSGFNIPISEWIDDALAGDINDTLSDAETATRLKLSPSVLKQLLSYNSQGNRSMVWSRIWSIYVLMNWCRLHNVYAV